MSRTETVTIYIFDELPDDRAKERARNWYREGALDYEWWDSVYEDADRIATIFGITLDRKRANNPNATSREPSIYFSGFCSQGDGACFEGSYEYAKGAPKKIREYAPQDTELHRIADELQALQRRYFYSLKCNVKHRGHYYHEHCTEFNVWAESDHVPPLTDDAEEKLPDLMRDFMRWIYRTLEKEYEWLMSDEQVDESIRCNEYEFEADGTRA